ncbi:MAG: chemotaxis protein CheX, partial [Spirochaetes bacterium]|nr:chemotaxis protein CheX [Spirochaetota bacterium]
MKKKTIARIKEALTPAVIKTFSDMAFIDAEVLKEIPEKLTYGHIIHISLSAPEHGEIALFLPSECKKMIVENIYGSDWTSLNATEIDDCLLEILNVLAGNFLTEYFGAGVKHDISLPELLFDAEMDEKNGFTELFFNAEDY